METRRSYGLRRQPQRGSPPQVDNNIESRKRSNKRRKISSAVEPSKNADKSSNSTRSTGATKNVITEDSPIVEKQEEASDAIDLQNIPEVSDLPLESVELSVEPTVEDATTLRQSEEADEEECASDILITEEPIQDTAVNDDSTLVPDWGEDYQLVSVQKNLQLGSLLAVESLAEMLLSLLGKGNVQDALDAVQEASSNRHQAYNTLKQSFAPLKRNLSGAKPFISSAELEVCDSKQKNIIRKANLATFIASISGSQEVGFYHMNESFLDIFLHEDMALSEPLAKLFVDLKTHAYFSAMANEAQCPSKEQILEDLFPRDLELQLLSRHSTGDGLSGVERELVSSTIARRAVLNQAPTISHASSVLENCSWESFLKGVHGFVKQEIAALGQCYFPAEPKMDSSDLSTYRALLAATNGTNGDLQQSSGLSIEEAAARAAEVAMASYLEADAEEGGAKQSINQDLGPAFESGQLSQGISSATAGIDVPFPSQSAPTQVLYERARLAASAKASPNNRRAGLPSQRRPWTPEEENSLMAGLDRVKGPHWSQILAMFGKNGSINETLRDRNQVQLKDKARNLKLFFLKSEIEVPYYLQFVTGELKTRAPGQAAKNEAKERNKIQEDEDKAHIEGILALASSGGRGNSNDTIDENHSQDGAIGQPQEQETSDTRPLSPDAERLRDMLETASAV
ncbi:MAG: TTAGGG repeat binding factor [Vezdaea aestivalis]|nr:MAG: TTAGGG repeat binding factor [Vezdaea aestivalis]